MSHRTDRGQPKKAIGYGNRRICSSSKESIVCHCEIQEEQRGVKMPETRKRTPTAWFDGVSGMKLAAF